MIDMKGRFNMRSSRSLIESALCSFAFCATLSSTSAAQDPAATSPIPTVAPPPSATTAAASPASSAGTTDARAEAAKLEKAATESAKGDIDALRTGKLIATGLTGGVAFAVQFTGPFNNESAKQENPKGTAMPYIMVLPGYWGARQATREACASAYTGAGEDTIDSAARAIARKRATRIVTDIESSIRAAGGPAKADAAQIARDLSLDYGGGPDDEQRSTNKTIVEQVMAYIGKEDAEAQRRFVIESMAGLEWKAAKDAACWPRRFGLWVGVPLNYETETTVPNGDLNDAQRTASRTVKPIVAFGLGFTPNAYFSVMAGLSASTVTRDATATSPAATHTIWATTLALGGNLDIVTAIAKGN